MGKCIIFCAARFDTLAEPLQKDDFVIAADGGLVHTEKLGIVPNEILGDFDSLGYTPQGANVFPVEKDDTDAMLRCAGDSAWAAGNLCFTAGWKAPGWTMLWPISRHCSILRTMVPSAIWWVDSPW